LADCKFEYGNFREAGAEDFGAHRFEGFLVVASRKGDTLSLLNRGAEGTVAIRATSMLRRPSLIKHTALSNLRGVSAALRRRSGLCDCYLFGMSL
jgi:hypothetical protein